MDFHGINTVGKIWIERVTTKPPNLADYDGRLILALDTGFLSFGVAGIWVDIASAAGVDVTSNPDPQIAVNTGDISQNASDITDIENDIVTNTPIWQAGVIPVNAIFLVDSGVSLAGWSLLSSITDTIIYVDSSNGPKAGSTWTQPQHAHATQSHALTINEMPSHDHPPKAGVSNFMSSTGSSHGEAGDSYGVHTLTGLRGGNQGHNHGNTYNNGTVGSWRPSGYNVTRQRKNAY